MRQREYDAAFIGGVEFAQAVGIPGITESEKTRKVMLVVLNAFRQHAQAVKGAAPTWQMAACPLSFS